MQHIASVIMGLLLALAGILPGSAQAQTDNPANLLVTGPDAQGIIQVYSIDTTTNAVTQLTEANANVEDYDVSPNLLAYVSGTQLFIKYQDGVTVQNLERPNGYRSSVHISSDEQEISYSDESGLYIFNRSTGVAEKLLDHKDFLDQNNPNGVGDGRFYYEALFLENSDYLLIGVGLWEASSFATYHRPTQTLTELTTGWNDPNVPFQLYNRILPLNDGSILLHNYDGRGCSPCGLWQAPSLDDILNYQQLLDNVALTNQPDENLIAPGIPAMVQLPDGTVRLLVQYSFIDANQEFQNESLILDFAAITNELTVIPSNMTPTITLYQPEFSADGRYITFWGGQPFDAPYSEYGQPVIYDVENGTLTVLDIGQQVNSARWAE